MGRHGADKREDGLDTLLAGVGDRLKALAGELVSFRGRARIVDVIYIYILLLIPSLLLRIPLNALQWDAEWYGRAFVDVALCVPFAALFVRRLHDQGLSGWWALLVPPFPVMNLYESYRVVFAVRNPEWLFQPDPLESWKVLLFPVALIVLVLLLRPGQQGPNRYGPDPRAAVAVVPA
jgi:uncharacterized membrane protein YhaH (DUF805 family)